MTESTVLNVKPRDVIGKSSHKLAAVGMVPAVLYGHGRDPLPLTVDGHDLAMLLAHHAAGSTLVALNIEGQSKPVDAMVKEVQNSPVKGTPMHVDFLVVSLDEIVQASVSIHLTGESPGVKAGGLLVSNMHTLSIEAAARSLPGSIDIDISSLDLGETLHVSDVVAPEGVTIMDDPEGIVCSVSTHITALEEEEVAAEEAEPEVIGKKAEEAEE